MKVCPQCRREYDQTMSFCLDDGVELLYGPSSRDEPVTEILHDTGSPSEAATRSQVHVTDQTRDLSTVILPADSAPRKSSGKVLAIVGIPAILVVAIGGYLWWQSSKKSAVRLGLDMKMSKLVTGIQGRPHNVSISPDGKYVAYALVHDGKSSLWLRQVSQNGSLQILQAVEGDFFSGTTFSRNGDLVYFVRGNRATDPRGTLYQVPVLGGVEPKKVLDFVQSSPSLSPDGKEFTFVRTHVNGKTEVIVASFDGSMPMRTVATRSGDSWFEFAAWSPDGKTIVCTTGTVVGGNYFGLVYLPSGGGDEQTIGRTWGQKLDPPRWRPDGQALLITAAERPGARYQFYSVSFPGGEETRLTNDTNDYFSPAATADGETLVTILTEGRRNIWSVDLSVPNGNPKQLTNGVVEGASGIAVLPDGRLTYSAITDDSANLWIINADGSGAKQLTSGLETSAASPATAPDGTIYFTSGQPDGVPRIWSITPDGSNLRQVTTTEEYNPNVSPDGRWLVFNSYRGGSGFPTIWKKSLVGNEEIQLTKTSSNTPVFSPDGKTIMYAHLDETGSVPRYRPAIINAENGELIKMLDMKPEQTPVAWSTDGKGLLFFEPRGGVGNVWLQPLDGGLPRQLTNFTSDTISRFALSPDGKTIYVSRGTSTNEIVLIKDFR